MKLPSMFFLKPVLRASKSAGFTMIELLVVISVIGVLAVAVLSSINPIEQINKGRDTRTRSDGAQLINAVDRYFAIHEIYPWNDATYATSLAGDTNPNTAFPDGTVCTATGAPDPTGFCDVTTSVAPDNWLFALSDTAEVKDSYVNRLLQAGNNPLYVYKAPVANATMYICFAPTSKAFEQEANKGCKEKADLPAGACPQGAPGNPLYPDAYLGELVCLP